MKNLSIVIVNWNTEKEVRDCLKSIEDNSDLKSIDVFVVDNNSSDNSVKTIEKEFGWVHLVKNKDNAGFGKANNQVLKNLKSEFVFILNR